MTRHLKQDDAVTPGALGLQRSAERPANSANDNDREGPFGLVPFPERVLGIPSRHRELNERFSTECTSPSIVHEELTIAGAGANFRSSWKVTLAKLGYALAVSLAMIGWLYFLWLALDTGLVWILS